MNQYIKEDDWLERKKGVRERKNITEDWRRKKVKMEKWRWVRRQGGQGMRGKKEGEEDRSAERVGGRVKRRGKVRRGEKKG